MKAPVVYVLGTPGGRWADWARAWLAPTPFHRELSLPGGGAARKPASDERIAAWLRSPDAEAAWGGVAADGWLAVDALAGRAPEAFFVALIERPSVGIAAALARGEKPDVPRWLDDWRHGARELLRLVQSQRPRCVLLDAEEAARSPSAAWNAVLARVGSALPDAGAPEPVRQDALCEALATTLASGRPELQALGRDLIAACEQLPSDTAPLPAAGSAELVDAFQSLRGAAPGLAAATRALDDERARSAALQTEVAAARAALADRDRHLQEARAAAASSESRLVQAAADSERHEQTERAAREALARLQADHAEARRALAEATADAARARQANDATSTARDEPHGLRQRADAARQDAAALLAQLHEAQEALEVVDARRRKLEAAAQARPPTGSAKWAPPLPTGDFDAGDIKIISAHHEPPYLGTTFALRRVKAAGREIGDALLRLVEHLGHPGLVLFAEQGRPPPLESFRATGSEDGRPYLMLMPSDAGSAPAFEAMGHDDWMLTLALAAGLERELRASSGGKRERWVALARRLHEQLLELPPRFRHAALVTQPLEGGGWAMRFGRASWDRRDLRGLTVHWRPDSAAAGVALVNTDGQTPLLSWPSGEDGKPPPQLVLPLAGQVGAEDRQRWQRVPATDRAFVAAMLAAWPRVVAGAAFERGDAALLARAAEKLRRDGAMLAAVPTGRTGLPGLLRRALRRLRQRSAT